MRLLKKMQQTKPQRSFSWETHIRASIHVRRACSVVRYLSWTERYEEEQWLFGGNETQGKLSLKQTSLTPQTPDVQPWILLNSYVPQILNVWMSGSSCFVQLSVRKAENKNFVSLILCSVMFWNLKSMNPKLEMTRLWFHLETICMKMCGTAFTTGGEKCRIWDQRT